MQMSSMDNGSVPENVAYLFNFAILIVIFIHFRYRKMEADAHRLPNCLEAIN